MKTVEEIEISIREYIEKRIYEEDENINLALDKKINDLEKQLQVLLNDETWKIPESWWN